MLTPLVQADGTAVVINRGWIPFSYTVDGPWTDFDPPTGTVSVLGMVQAPQVRPTSGLVTGPSDAADGVLRAARPGRRRRRLQQQVDEPLLPALRRPPGRSSRPSPAPLPEPVPDPELSEGPHLNYAGQWFIFALLDDHRVPAAAAPGRPPPPARASPTSSSEIVDLGARPTATEPTAAAPPVPARAAVSTPADTRERVLEAALACIEREGLGGHQRRGRGPRRVGVAGHDLPPLPGRPRAAGAPRPPRGRSPGSSPGSSRPWPASPTSPPGCASRCRRATAPSTTTPCCTGCCAPSPRRVLTELSVATDLVLELIIAYLGRPARGRAGRRAGPPDLDVPEAADYLGRLYLSYLGRPGRWDLDDPDQVDRLVRTQFMAGIPRRLSRPPR